MRMQCGCRRRSVRKNGHRPACQFYDQDRANGHRARRRFARKWEDAGATFDHAPGVTLWV